MAEKIHFVQKMPTGGKFRCSKICSRPASDSFSVIRSAAGTGQEQNSSLRKLECGWRESLRGRRGHLIMLLFNTTSYTLLIQRYCARIGPPIVSSCVTVMNMDSCKSAIVTSDPNWHDNRFANTKCQVSATETGIAGPLIKLQLQKASSASDLPFNLWSSHKEDAGSG